MSVVTQFIKPAQIQKLSVFGAKAFKPVTTVAHRFGPEILTATGIVGGVTSGILAARATLKLEAIVELTQSSIEAAESPREAAKARLEGILAIAKLYGPSVTLGAASIGAILGAHGIMRKRNVALVAAYKAIETSFEQYRKRVAEQIGEEREGDIRRGFVDEKVKDENGTTKKVTHVDPNTISQYVKFFDETNDMWSKTPEYNMYFLKSEQNYLNDMLHARGHVFLNEAYDRLHFDRTKAGSVVGWFLDKDNDNFIDFGIYDFESAKAREFVNGIERSVMLDFNVDGVIIDKI